MATWDKDIVVFELINSTTGSPDTTAHTVQLQPVTSAYPTGAVTCSQLSTVLSMYKPNSDLDDINHYFIYVDAVKTDLLISIASEPPIGA